MKDIVLQIDDLRERCQKLRYRANQYNEIEEKLNSIMHRLQDVYKESNIPLVEEDLNLAVMMDEMSNRLRYLANVLEERANSIENDYHQ